ncbi:glycosyltransferase family 4 protein [Parerythrobacter aurantius]|uniref:glycosyltransferase family 4 protein n=1 Tax=Parerythrobacter aurantius TaxID=3127706 RepID=UPI003245D677
MRFLHLHSTFSAGGKELRCVQLINAFGPAIGHTIVSGVPGAMGAADHFAAEARVDFPTDFPSLAGKPWPWRLLGLARAMAGYDLVLTYNWGAMDAALAHALYSMPMGLPPLIHHEDGFNEDERNGLNPWRNRYRRLALARAQHLVVPSETLEQVALGAWNQPPRRVRRIPNGIDTAAFAAAPMRDAIPGLVKPAGEKWVGTLAGLRQIKNLPRLVRAFSGLPAPWKLVIVGEGPEEHAIRAEADRAGVGDRVILPGFAAEPARYVGLFDIFALSSDSEQFPISLVEAMAAGLPVAAPSVGDVAAMVAPANVPYVVAAGDDTALGAALLALSGDEALRRKIGEANRARACERFDASEMVAAYRKLYGRAAGIDEGL